MSDIESIAETMAVDFTAAVKSANKAKQAKVDAIAEQLRDADGARNAGLLQVRRMQEEAAKIVAESLKFADKVEARYRDDLRQVEADLAELRGPQVARSGRPKLVKGGDA